MKVVDTILERTDEDAIEMTRRLAKEEGLLVGTFSEADVWAAIRLPELRGGLVTP